MKSGASSSFSLSARMDSFGWQVKSHSLVSDAPSSAELDYLSSSHSCRLTEYSVVGCRSASLLHMAKIKYSFVQFRHMSVMEKDTAFRNMALQTG